MSSNDQQQANGQILDLGSRFTVYLNELCQGTARHTIDQVMAALEVTTSLRELYLVNFSSYEPTPEHNRRFIDPLCHWIANLQYRRRGGANHEHYNVASLLKLTLCASGDVTIAQWNVWVQFLTAAQHGEIRHIGFETVDYVPVHFVMDYCRNHTKLESLSLWHVTLVQYEDDDDDEDEDDDDYDDDGGIIVYSTHAITLKSLSLGHILFCSTHTTRHHVSTMERASVTLDIETGQYFREFSFLSRRKLGGIYVPGCRFLRPLQRVNH